jgi:UDP-N-acetyl-D-glucosamine dehydrogenase
LMEKLRDLGARVAYSDPHVPSFPKMRAHSFDLSSVSLDAENLKLFDCVLLATDHDRFDYELIRTQSRLVVDCRGKFLRPAGNVVSA